MFQLLFTACSVLENTSKTRVGSKRNWNIANQAESPDPALASSVKKDTLRPTNFGRIVISDICFVNSYEFSYLISS